MQYLRTSLSYHLSLRPLFCLFLSDCLRQVLCIFVYFTDMDGPRRNYSHYGSVEDIDRYDDYRDRMYMHDKHYVDDRDYWWYRRYHDGDNLPSDVRHMHNEYPKKRFIPVYHDNISHFNDKSNVWYTRQIIDYSDDAKYHRHPSFPPSYHEEPYEPILPREPIAIVDSSPLEPIENVALYVEHEPTYAESVYKDIGHYELETVPAPPTPPQVPPQVHNPRNSHRVPREDYEDIEALYSKPMKSSVRLREIDDHGREGRELPRVREVRVISIEPDRRRSEREIGHHFQRSRDVDQRFRHSALELHKTGHNFQRNRDVDQRFRHSGLELHKVSYNLIA